MADSTGYDASHLHELGNKPLVLLVVLIAAHFGIRAIEDLVRYTPKIVSEILTPSCEATPPPPGDARISVLVSLANSSKEKALRFRNSLADRYRVDGFQKVSFVVACQPPTEQEVRAWLDHPAAQKVIYAKTVDYSNNLKARILGRDGNTSREQEFSANAEMDSPEFAQTFSANLLASFEPQIRTWNDSLLKRHRVFVKSADAEFRAEQFETFAALHETNCAVQRGLGDAYLISGEPAKAEQQYDTKAKTACATEPPSTHHELRYRSALVRIEYARLNRISVSAMRAYQDEAVDLMRPILNMGESQRDVIYAAAALETARIFKERSYQGVDLATAKFVQQHVYQARFVPEAEALHESLSTQHGALLPAVEGLERQAIEAAAQKEAERNRIKENLDRAKADGWTDGFANATRKAQLAAAVEQERSQKQLDNAQKQLGDSQKQLGEMKRENNEQSAKIGFIEQDNKGAYATLKEQTEKADRAEARAGEAEVKARDAEARAQSFAEILRQRIEAEEAAKRSRPSQATVTPRRRTRAPCHVLHRSASYVDKRCPQTAAR